MHLQIASLMTQLHAARTVFAPSSSPQQAPAGRSCAPPQLGAANLASFAIQHTHRSSQAHNTRYPGVPGLFLFESIRHPMSRNILIAGGVVGKGLA